MASLTPRPNELVMSPESPPPGRSDRLLRLLDDEGEPMTEAAAPLQDFLEDHDAASSDTIDDEARDVGGRIVEAREAAGLTMDDVANHVGVKASTVAKWERGSAPRSNRIVALAGVLGVTPTWLLMGHGIEPRGSSELDDVRQGLARVRQQLLDAVAEVDAMAQRLDAGDWVVNPDAT